MQGFILHKIDCTYIYSTEHFVSKSERKSKPRPAGDVENGKD